MRFSYVLLALPLAFNSVYAEETKSEQSVQTITEKILSQGVPAPAFKMLTTFMKEHQGQEYLQEVYGCPTYVKEEPPAPKEEPKKEDDKTSVTKTDEAKSDHPAENKTDEEKKSDAKAALLEKAVNTKSTDSKAAPKAEAKKVEAKKPVAKPAPKVTYREVAPTEPTVKPCEDKKRVKMTKKVKFESPTWVAIVDFSQPSTARRFFLINLKTGEVQKYYTTHGKGSGNANYPTKFSNRKDSLQTSLGFYVTGETYVGSYGDTLRLYGLQRSNDQAFNRDIVVHGAWYVGEDFINSINSQTKKKYGRLGVSWGCPALGLGVAPKIIGLLKGGSVLFHYHPEGYEKAQSGQEITVSAPVEVPVAEPSKPLEPSKPAEPVVVVAPAPATPAVAPTVVPSAPTAPTGTVAETSSEPKASAPTAGSN